MDKYSGKIIKHYHLQDVIGSGSMGVVYKALDTRLDRLVAIKFLPQHLGREAAFKARFQREARTVSALDHPNICTIHDFFEDHEPALVMPYYEGQTLKAIIRERPLAVGEALTHIVQIGNGLTAAHAAGIIHRDIKPENIIITADGIVKIMDFGISKMFGSSQLTKTGTTMGTTAYMSPEQATGEKLDQRTDIWSMGVVLYEMLTQKIPFSGDNDPAAIYAIMNKEPISARTFNSDIPEEIDELIAATLAKDKRKRVDSARYFQDVVREVSPESLVNLPVVSSSSFRPAFRRRRKLKILFAALSIGAIFISPLLYYFKDPSVQPVKSQPEGVSIAVLPFTTSGDVGWIQKAVPDQVITRLGQSKYISIKNGTEAGTFLSERNVQNPHNIDNIMARELANTQGLDYLIFGNIINAGSLTRLSFFMYDLQNKRSLFTRSVPLDDDSQFFTTIDRLNDEIRIQLEIKATQTAIDTKYGTRTASIDAYRSFIEGVDNFEKGDIDRAITLLQEAVGADSTFARAYEYLTTVYRNIGANDMALQYIISAIHHSKDYPEATRLNFQMQRARLEGRYTTVKQILKKIINLQPDNAEWRFKLGWHQSVHDRDFKQSIISYRQAIKRDSSRSAYFQRYMAGSYWYEGKFDKVEATLEQALRKSPTLRRTQHRLAEALFITGDHKSAASVLQRAMQQDADLPFINALQGRLFSILGRTNEALQAFDNELASITGPDMQRDAYCAIAEHYFQNEQFSEAAESIQNAMANERDASYPTWISGRIQVANGDTVAARESLQRIHLLTNKEGSKFNRELYHHLEGKILQAQKKYAEAARAFKRALENGVWDRPLFILSLAELYFEARDYENALDYCNEVEKINKNHPQSWYLKGQIFIALGEEQKAISAFRKCTTILKDADAGSALLQKAKAKLEQFNLNN